MGLVLRGGLWFSPTPMLAFFSTLHVVLCVFMTFVILLQPGKDAGMGAALGGGAATTAFGGRGAVTFLGKVTAVSAIAFFLTSLGLSFVGLRTSVAASVAAAAAAKSAGEAPATTPTDEKTDAPASGASQGDPNATPGKAPPTEEKPSGADAVPADKLPR
jgi:preprotein translocase subunit SecG